LATLDIFVLYQNCDIGTALNVMQKSDLNNWVAAGGKLIIFDSDSCGTVSGGPVPDYSWLALPFRTNNPGQTGTTGTLLNIIENNSLSSTDVNSPYYIDTQNITNSTDAAGDGNVMITQDSRWCGDMLAQNVNNISGWVHTYGAYGNGLIIYDGMDADSMGSNAYLNKVWLLELLQAWRPSGLPCGAQVAALKLPFTSVSGSWRVCGGYYHFDHLPASGTQFGLDFCHNGTTTANQVVLAPAEGKVAGVFTCGPGGGWGLKLELTRGGQTIVNQDGTKNSTDVRLGLK